MAAMTAALVTLRPLSLLALAFAAGLSPVREEWDYAPAMRQVARKSTARPGVVLHIGDSITYANPYSQWARLGKGKTPEDRAVLEWMHTGAGDDTDGWHLASVDRPGGRSETAVGGIRADEFLAGGKAGIPPLRELVRKYRPQVVVLLLGTNDASAQRPVEAYRSDMARHLDGILAEGAVPILSTLPPHPAEPERVKSYNRVLIELARERRIPLIDFWTEIIRRRPQDWNGTLLGRDDVHPTAGIEGVTPVSEPTEENLRRSGYLLRGWLSVRKIAEVKARVFDSGAERAATGDRKP